MHANKVGDLVCMQFLVVFPLLSICFHFHTDGFGFSPSHAVFLLTKPLTLLSLSRNDGDTDGGAV